MCLYSEKKERCGGRENFNELKRARDGEIEQETERERERLNCGRTERAWS